MTSSFDLISYALCVRLLVILSTRTRSLTFEYLPWLDALARRALVAASLSLHAS